MTIDVSRPHPEAISCSALHAARFAVVLLLLALLASCGRSDPELALREDIASLQAALEARDASKMADFLADDFVGNDGLDRDGARRMAALYFLRNAEVGILLGPLDVRLQDGHATVHTTVVLTGGHGGLLPERGRVRAVTSGWRREGDDWRMTSLAWDDR